MKNHPFERLFADPEHRLSLRDITPSEWQQVQHDLHSSTPPRKKLLLFLRHAEGLHNVAEAEFGPLEWNLHLSTSPEYFDPILTPLGRSQAQDAAAELREAMLGYHEASLRSNTSRRHDLLDDDVAILVSPLRRTIETASIVFSTTNPSSRRPLLILAELCRETLGVHTCDARHTKSFLQHEYHGLNVDYTSLDEVDRMWQPTHRETSEEMQRRARDFLTHTCTNARFDPSPIIIVVSHSGFIHACQEILDSTSRHKLDNGEWFPMMVHDVDAFLDAPSSWSSFKNGYGGLVWILVVVIVGRCCFRGRKKHQNIDRRYSIVLSESRPSLIR